LAQCATPWRSSIERLDATSSVFICLWRVHFCLFQSLLLSVGGTAPGLVAPHKNNSTAPDVCRAQQQLFAVAVPLQQVEALRLRATLTCWVQRKAYCMNALSPGLVAARRRGVARQMQVLFCPRAMPCFQPVGNTFFIGSRQSHEARMQGSVQVTLEAIAAQRGVNLTRSKSHRDT